MRGRVSEPGSPIQAGIWHLGSTLSLEFDIWAEIIDTLLTNQATIWMIFAAETRFDDDCEIVSLVILSLGTGTD